MWRIKIKQSKENVTYCNSYGTCDSFIAIVDNGRKIKTQN